MDTKNAIHNFCLRLADNNLILAQRLAEWCSRGPILEEDLALSNIALDLFGQAESLYEYAASINEFEKSADDLAFRRSEREYFNNILVEQPNGDFAFSMMKQFLFSSFTKIFYESLQASNDQQLQALSAKAIKEINYHLRHSSEWIIRFGNGTDESHRRTQFAIDELWRFTDDMFYMNEIDEELISLGISFNLSELYPKWKFKVSELLQEANLQLPDSTNIIVGGCNGIHSEHLGKLLCEMQYLQHAHPQATW